MFKKVAVLMMAIPLLMVYAGGINAVSAAEDGYHPESKTLTYACEALVPFEMPVTINGNVPDSVEPGEEFTITNSSTTVTLPANIVGALGGLLGGSAIGGEATAFNLIAENESATINVAKDPIAISKMDLPEGKELTFTVPEGGIEAGPFVAGESGDVTISAGTIKTALDLYDAEGNIIGGKVEATCTPVEGQDTTVNTIPIEEPEPEDTDSPVITMNGENPMELEVGDNYEEPGATAEDNADGNLTEAIKITGEVSTGVAGEYTVTYSVTDEAGNKSTKTRTVNVVEPEEPVDEVAPVITLNGENPMELEVGAVYEEPRATAEDNVDGDLTEAIKITGEVNTSVAGEYTVTYTVTDEAGNESTETRTVNVKEPDEEEEPPVNESGTWYSGEGEPNNEIGTEGDLYLDTATFEVYKRGAEGWGDPIGTLKGEDGETGEPGYDGNTIVVGEGEPGSMDVRYGDLYLDTVTGDLYRKGETDWNLVGNLQGPPGQNGEDGECNCEDDEGTADENKGSDESDEVTAGSEDNSSNKGEELPDTATNNPLNILIGSLMAVAGGALVFIRKKVLG